MGLNFDQTMNGRAYGHGVYFSEHLSYSLSYARNDVGAPWPNSDLRTSQAISMCEIVNEKESFVCTTPHLVVNQLDWIQCRFLFARVNPTPAATDSRACFPQGQKLAGSTSSPEYLENIQIRGKPQTSIKIPVSAISSCAKDFGERVSRTAKLRIGAKRRSTSPRACDPEEAGCVGIDLDGILNAEDASHTKMVQTPLKRRKEGPAATDFEPDTLDWTLIPKLPDPLNPSPSAQKMLMQEFHTISKVQASTDLADRGWYIDLGKLENMFHWIVELHSFDQDLPLARDMKKKGCKSIVLELTFGSTYPMTPPFARIIRPRFLEFASGGGGNVTQGGSICSELLVTQGWSPTMGIEKVILQIRLQLCDLERPARLKFGGHSDSDYTVAEALESYRRAAEAHGWSVSSDLSAMAAQWTRSIL